MADSRVSDLTALTGTDLDVAADKLYIVDVSQSGITRSKSITVNELLNTSITIGGNLSVNGNTTIGDTSGDTLTINAGTWTIGNNIVATRAAGTLAAGGTNLVSLLGTFTGDAGGTTVSRTLNVTNTSAGANAISVEVGIAATSVHAGSATLSTARGVNAGVTVSSSGNITNALIYSTNITLSSTGAITTLTGFNATDLGHATLVTNAIGFDAVDFTGSLTLTVAFRSQMSSGTGKWGYLATGTAANGFASDLTIYTGTAIPAGGTAGSGYKLSSTANFGVFFGSSAPTLSAAKGSLYLRSDGTGTTDRAYINTNGGTTWTALTTVA